MLSHRFAVEVKRLAVFRALVTFVTMEIVDLEASAFMCIHEAKDSVRADREVQREPARDVDECFSEVVPQHLSIIWHRFDFDDSKVGDVNIIQLDIFLPS